MFQSGCSPLVYSLLCVSGEFALPRDHHLSTTERFLCALCSELLHSSSTEKSSRPSLKLLLILGERGNVKNKQCQETGSKKFMLNFFNPWNSAKICITPWIRDSVWSPQHSSGFFRASLDQVCPSIWLCRALACRQLAPLGAPQRVRNVTQPQSRCLLLSSLPHAALHSFGVSCLNLRLGHYWPFLLVGSTNGTCSLAP